VDVTASDPAAPTVELTGVSYSYPSPDGPVTVLSSLSLTVHPGEFVAVIGPSGSGKSTLLNILGSLVLPEGGAAHVAGIDLMAMDAAAAERYRQRQIAFIFQFFNLFPTLTAEENVQLSLEAMEPPPPDVVGLSRDALRRVGLQEKLCRIPAQLSGGEQQRVAIARALARRAPLILADEPTGNLDAATAVAVLDVLDECRRASGAAMVLITHDLDVARRADRALRLSGGRLEPVSFDDSEGTPEPAATVHR
jgi:putative ABC transport system ATP-binding protein